jgi:hypothetical protein
MKTILLIILLSITFNSKAIISKQQYFLNTITATDSTTKISVQPNQETVLYFPSFLATLGFAFSIIAFISLLYNYTTGWSILLGLIAIIFVALGFAEIRKKKIRGRTLAIAGLILALITTFAPFIIKK